MGKRISQQQHSYQIQIDLSPKLLGEEIRRAYTVCDGLSQIRNTVGLLLDLCEGGRKVNPVHLSGVLEMVDEALDEVGVLAHERAHFLKELVPTPSLQDGADGGEKAGLRLAAVD